MDITELREFCLVMDTIFSKKQMHNNSFNFDRFYTPRRYTLLYVKTAS